MVSDTAAVRILAERIHRLQRRGPQHVRNIIPWAEHRPAQAQVKGFNAVDMGAVAQLLDLPAWKSGARRVLRRLLVRANKKAGQPYRKNKNRKAMQRRAAGKNSVTR